jgi:ATP-dependent Lon protease
MSSKNFEIMSLPVFFLYRRVVFPFCPLEIKSSSPLPDDIGEGGEIIVLPVKNMLGLVFSRGSTGVRSQVLSVAREENHYRIKFQGIRRVQVKKVRSLKTAEFYEPAGEDEGEPRNSLELLRKRAQELIFLINTDTSDRLIRLLEYIPDLSQLTDFIGNYFVLDFTRRIKLIKTFSARRRAELLVKMLENIIVFYKKKKGISG